MVSLFQTLYFVVQNVLTCSDDRCLEIIAQRFESATDDIANGTIWDVDEAVRILDKDDVEEMKDEQKAERTRRTTREAFAIEFGAKRREVDLFKLQQQQQQKQNRREENTTLMLQRSDRS